jgi:hypothetical protein
VDAGESSLLQ